MNEHTHDTTGRPAHEGTAALWASAAALAGMILMVAGRSPVAPQPAFAEMAAIAGDYAAVTTQGQSSAEELLYVLDQRAERLLVYRVENQRSLVLQRSEDISTVFAQARAAAGGR
ncbi:MAG: hypothetical protein AAFX79_07440 [Planctomycetota bacterium]